ncbi:hypothetical protein FRB93_000957 [Tulasnella sp. JGI-2019a]|nr:hypothetical protein FRB93_000957 [Tulasnella sp. JGI-2019a]
MKADIAERYVILPFQRLCAPATNLSWPTQMTSAPKAHEDKGEFAYTVVEKKRRKGKEKPPAPPLTFETLMIKTRRDLEASSYWSDVKSMVENLGHDNEPQLAYPMKVLCLGLGSPKSSDVARQQLILMKEFQLLFDICDSNVSLYDPAFSKEDAEELRAMGYLVILENKSGRHALEAPTLVFMPHCDAFLYEGILYENWTPKKLSLLTLVGNNLQQYTVK